MLKQERGARSEFKFRDKVRACRIFSAEGATHAQFSPWYDDEGFSENRIAYASEKEEKMRSCSLGLKKLKAFFVFP